MIRRGARTHLEDTVCSGALGVHNTLGNTLAIEVSEAAGAREGSAAPSERKESGEDEHVDQVEVLQEERSVGSETLSGLSILDGLALRSGEDGAVRLRDEAGQGQPSRSLGGALPR